ncbi:helix-turn-helix domain-containing protein [Cohnella sp. AR92]|uniref:helix-turn-helix domain-containing protein n=1 Tax=Cohnella sp. AR92 TaxID=648716 RepID=UPI000F8E23A5|nr:AraC family transcriptional regulator [Cohnella sp. AR92]RUS42864.1 AraC family transcriptional regulator [Cohnella sp. AR92]
MKKIEVQLCDYSRHLEFRQSYPAGLDTYIVRLQAEGVSRALVGGELREIVPGDLLLFKPGEPYELRIGETETPAGAKGSGDYFIMCLGEGMDEWWEQRRRPTKSRIAEDGRINAIWQQLILEHRRLGGGDPELITLLARTLLAMLDRAIAEVPEARSAVALHALRMRSFIENHSTEELKLEDVARDAQLSVSRAVHLFKEHFGISIIAYLQQIRLAHAMNLLAYSQLSLEQIAAESGLGSYAYLHRLFRARYGLSPGAYRKKHRAASHE